MIRLALVAVLFGCNVGESPTTKTQTKELDPRALALHTLLFTAADKGDVAHFKRLLSVKSVELVDNHLKKMNALPRPVGETEMTWANFVALHAGIPKRNRHVTPYKVIHENGKWRLNLSNATGSKFFRWETPKP